jgi:alkylated DNA nucleotide flippase Atl1
MIAIPGGRVLTVVALAAMLGASAGWARDDAGDAIDSARAEMLRTAREYRTSLDRVLELQEEAAGRAAATAAERRALAEEGILSRREAEQSEAAAAAAEEAVARTRASIAQADALVVEAEAERHIAELPPAPLGETYVTPTLVRHMGGRAWSLAMAPTLGRLFADRFGRSLPVSAFGQTAVHDRLGFDHRNAIDVAVHPDSTEGQALMAWLRERGVSYLAFRGAVPGASTGAHIHIGDPSPRLGA